MATKNEAKTADLPSADGAPDSPPATAAPEPSLPATTSEKALATLNGGGALPDFLAASVGEDAGAGLSTSADDNIVPLLYVLQSNSPQVNQRGADAIKGAAPGDIWIKGTDKAVPGAEGISVQPCAFRKDWVEWVPRSAGGGYVGRHDECPKDAVEKTDGEGRKRLVLPNGNEINETRYHYVLINGSPVVIPFSSTGHTVSRDWMHKMNGVRLADKRSVPSFAKLWKLTTKERTNKAGTWFVLATEDDGFVADVGDYELGKKFNEQVEAGLVKADAEDAAQNQSSGGGSHDPQTGEIKGADVPF